MLAVKHFNHLLNAITLPRSHDPRLAVNVFCGGQLDLKAWHLSRRMHRGLVRRLCHLRHTILLHTCTAAIFTAARFAVSVATYTEVVRLRAPVSQSQPFTSHRFPFLAGILWRPLLQELTPSQSIEMLEP